MLMFMGLVFGSLAADPNPWGARAFSAGLVASLVFTATAFISYVVAPHWMWMYLIDPTDVRWTLPLIAIGYVITYMLGYAAALGLRPLGRNYAIAASVAALIGEVVVVAITWDRYRAVGTTEEWLRGAADPLLGTSPEGAVRVIAPLGPIFLVVAAVAIFMTVRGGRAPVADR